MAAIPRNSDTRDVQYRASKSGGFQVDYRYHLSPWLAVQGNYGYSRAMHRFTNILGETDIQANLHQLTGEAVITAPCSSRVRPYGLAGFGALFFRPTNNPNANFFGVGSNQSRPSFVYGGGVDFDLVSHIALRGEYRGYVYKVPDFQIPGLAPDNFTHLAEPSVGLVLRF